MAKPLVLWQSHHHLIMLLPPRDYLKFQIRNDILPLYFFMVQFSHSYTVWKNMGNFSFKYLSIFDNFFVSIKTSFHKKSHF